MKSRVIHIYLVRHGESLANLRSLMAGHSDFELTEKGLEQAYITANALVGLDFLGIHSSDLLRAVSTAAPHALLRGISADAVKKSVNLRELYCGEWENRSFDELTALYGELYTVTWRNSFGDFRAPGGESIPELADRIHDELVKICHGYDKYISDGGEANLLVVSHGGAIRAFWGKISHLSCEEVSTKLPFASNASYSIVDFNLDTDEFSPRRYSVDEHLAELKTFFNG